MKSTQRNNEKIELSDGAILLVIVSENKVTHYSGNLLLSHVEFVKRSCGTLPAGCWVGTVHKTAEGIAASHSKTFYGHELPAPEWVGLVVRATFC